MEEIFKIVTLLLTLGVACIFFLSELNSTETFHNKLWAIYVQRSSLWWESSKDGHMSSYLSKEKGPHVKKISPKTNMCHEKEETNVERWGTKMQKVGMVEVTKGRWQACN